MQLALVMPNTRIAAGFSTLRALWSAPDPPRHPATSIQHPARFQVDLNPLMSIVKK